jgi:cyanophycin synthetase
VVILAEGEKETPFVSVSRVPLTHLGRVRFQVENVLAAVAAAWALGVPDDEIRAGLASFTSSTQQAPGRFNVLESNGSTVIIDYGHNPAALRAQIGALETIPHQRRRIIFSAEGDRRDIDILQQAELLAGAFDEVLIHEYDNLRGRPKGDVLRLLQEGLARGTRVGRVRVEPNESTAIHRALEDLQPSDLLIIQPKAIDDVIAQVQEFLINGRTVPLQEPEPQPIEAEVALTVPTAD